MGRKVLDGLIKARDRRKVARKTENGPQRGIVKGSAKKKQRRQRGAKKY